MSKKSGVILIVSNVIFALAALFFFVQSWLYEKDFWDGVEYWQLYKAALQEGCVSYSTIEQAALPLGWEPAEPSFRARAINSIEIANTYALVASGVQFGRQNNKMDLFFLMRMVV